MRLRFSLAHLTVIRLAPPQVIEVAARTGYDTVGLRLIGGTEITPAYPLTDDKPLMRATKAAAVYRSAQPICQFLPVEDESGGVFR